MLFDPKWEKTETKADPFSLESLIAWLEKQEPAERYDFCEWNQCLLGRWLRSMDPTARVDAGKGTGFFYVAFGRVVDLSKFGYVAHGGAYWKKEYQNYGAALARARAVHASHMDT